MSIVLVTGTSTDVGKTVVTAALASVALGSGRSVAVLKPAQTGVGVGEPGDLAEVDRLTGGGATLVELARYPDPLAPDVAARRSGLPSPTLADVVAAATDLDVGHDLTLIEGAGGLLVRLGAEGFTLRDVATALSAPVVLVVASGLGTLNHTALTVEALRMSAVRCAGLVIGSWPRHPELADYTNRDELASVSGVPVRGAVPAGAGLLGAGEFKAIADIAVNDLVEYLPV
ncbi:dethiobiotin synthetase [Rhodococcus sp. 27YEA15]|uniref:dethiobiotin synthase n=1 Tax=Rhodococcus sp. 27YEA15 TaxID=3156259 RepID=UPI003C7A4E57